MAQLLDGSNYPFYQYHMGNTGISCLRTGDEIVLDYFDSQRHLSGVSEDEDSMAS